MTAYLGDHNSANPILFASTYANLPPPASPPQLHDIGVLCADAPPAERPGSGEKTCRTFAQAAVVGAEQKHEMRSVCR